MVTPEEIGSILTKVALADQGFLVLVLTAAAKASSGLTPEEQAKLVEWGKETLARGREESDRLMCH